MKTAARFRKKCHAEAEQLFFRTHSLVNSLDVHIEHGGGVNVEPPLFLQVDNQRLLLLELDIEPFGL